MSPKLSNRPPKHANANFWRTEKAMLWTITKKQLLVNLLSYRFVVGFVLCQVLFVLATVILVRDYEERVKAHGEAVSRESKKLDEVKVYSDLARGMSVYKPPARLSPICMGFDKTFGNQAAFAYSRAPELEVGRQEKNALLVALRSLDLVTVIQLVLGLLVLLFAHDAVSGERERGTLALSMSGPLPRHIFLLGQYLGGMLTISAVFLVGIFFALLVMIRSASVQLGGSDWLRLGLIILVSLVYLSALYLLGVVTSILSKRSATALVILLFFWIVFIVIFPNLTSAVASKIKPVPARGLVAQQTANLRREFWTGIDQNARKTLPRPAHKWEFIAGRYVYGGDLPYPIRLGYAPREIMEWELEGLQRFLPLEIEYANRMHEVQAGYERQLHEQAATARFLARISPAWSYFNAVSGLAGTDAEAYTTFLAKARNYRLQVLNYLSSKDGLVSYRYFTRLEPSRFRTTAELELLQKQGDRLKQEMGKDWDSVPPLDLRDLPTFDHAPAPVATAVAGVLPDVVLLVFLNLALFLAAHVCFLRTDVRAGG